MTDQTVQIVHEIIEELGPTAHIVVIAGIAFTAIFFILFIAFFVFIIRHMKKMDDEFDKRWRR